MKEEYRNWKPQLTWVEVNFGLKRIGPQTKEEWEAEQWVQKMRSGPKITLRELLASVGEEKRCVNDSGESRSHGI